MKIHHFDRRGFYTGSEKADPSPLEPGKYLVPAGATMVKPPSVSEGKVPKWNGAAWEPANPPKPNPASDPVQKLRRFLATNPDVAAVVGDVGEPSA